MDDGEVIQIRKDKAVEFLKKNYNLISYVILAVITYLAVRIRVSNLSGLKDITTGTWTLGPDLDPFLFLRWAEYIVAHGKLMAVDMMRYAPLGVGTNGEYLLHPYMIAWFHKLAVLFGSESVTHSAIIYPAFMFGLTVIAFFLMTRKMFVKSMGEISANVIALIASFFLSVFPVLLPRTIAGIPEKESAAFLFMFLAFYFFISSWNSKTAKSGVILAIFAGISTAAMAHVWGGYIYIFFVIGPSVFLAFLTEKIEKKELYVYVSWIVSSMLLMLLFFGKYTFLGFFRSPSTSFSIFVLLIILMDMFVLNRKKIEQSVSKSALRKVPPKAISVFISLIAALIIGSILMGPMSIYSQAINIKDALIQPTASRLIQTVAENRQPYFIEWENSFGPHFHEIAITFWLFFIGSTVLFYSMMKLFDKKYRLMLTGAYVFFLVAIIFSKYSSSSSLNGINSLSLFVYSMGFVVLLFSLGKKGFDSFANKNLYYGAYIGLTLSLFATFFVGSTFVFSVLVAIFALAAGIFSLVGITNQKEFRGINFELILLLIFFFLGIVSTRAGIRFIMMLAPPASIILSYLIVKSYSLMAGVTKEKNKLYLFVGLFIVVLVTSLFSANTFYKSINAQAEGYIPSIYTQQWQKAMAWTRENTPQNAVFGHWWDYGYWIQSIGERTTVLDGGNMISYWNHLMGRYALTGPNETEALEFLYAHNTTHFLIDSTDIGKYSAFSTIGSDANYDRASYLPTFARDPNQVQEKKNSTVYLYSGGVGLDEDIVYEQNGTKIFLPAGNAGLGAILTERNTEGKLISAPIGIFVYQGKQYGLPLRYAYDKELIDFGEGIEAGIFLYPTAVNSGQNLQIDKVGALLYLSKRTVNSQLARIYLYEDEGSRFKLVHSEDDFVVAQIKSQDASFDSDFIQYQGFRGPIKIWEIDYPEDIMFREEFISTIYPEELYKA